ncbi:MAG TPA: hypothetical protein IGS53_07100 [Leptolyngbyaceae cyanobacterium M33_DOE_097]|uniref:Isopropylmalate/homocitrate/citramalate synthase n=1 Tax=Oscillatoriales cyanobacterium SpSt-418 TaxID=2282169 RepID=A0A7C3KIV0_9CYAN|nr:hypothetical protein [Leptolyngbyaceae cyanobacterium M33_DOE_097]
MQSLSNFLYPRSRYYGQIKPENLMFNANLQEFAQRVMFVADLETGGKLSSQAAYEQIKTLWEQLSQANEQLGVGKS